jgi:hypothetical protein
MRPLLSNAALAALALALSLGAAGCRPDIGESCSNSIECSSQGDRICDTSLPSGYCTIYNCEADGCPDESTCVAFARSEDPYADACPAQGWARFERTFCLGSCSNDGDCRGGYLCARPGRLNEKNTEVLKDYGARILDVDPSKPGVCVALGSQGPDAPQSMSCPPPPPACFPDYGGSGEGVCGAGGAAGGGGGGAGGAAGQSGAAGEAGAGGEGGGGAGSGGAAGSGGEAGAGGAGGEAAGAGGAAGAAGGGGAGGGG